MAGYLCELGDEDHPAEFIFTSLANGQTTAFCAEDAPIALIGALAASLGVESSPLYDVVKRYVDREAASEAKAAEAAKAPEAPEAPKAPGKRARRTARADPEDEPSVRDEANAAARAQAEIDVEDLADSWVPVASWEEGQ